MNIFYNRSEEGKRGFTLIELLVVIAIIGILASVILASLNSARVKGRDARRLSDISQLKTTLELYYDAQGTTQTYPIGDQTATGATSFSGGLAPTFISALPTDPRTGGSYLYQSRAASDGSACSTSPCNNYVLGATLEDDGNNALSSDLDGTVAGVDCTETTAPTYRYCTQP